MIAAARRLSQAIPLDWFVLILLVLAWGSSFASMKVALTGFDAAWIAVLRLWVAAAVLLVLLPLVGERLPPRQRRAGWGAFAWVGVTGTALPFFLFAWGTARADSAVVAICNGASPIFTALAAHLLLATDRLSLTRFLGVMTGFAGLVTLVAPEVAAVGLGGASVLGMLAGLAGAACYAAANIITRSAPPVGPTAASLIYCATGALLGTGAALLVSAPWQTAPLSAWVHVVLLGVFPTALAGIGYVWIIQRRGPVFASLATYLAPVCAMGLGILFLGEQPGWNAYAALALILVGVWLASRQR
jgi:drug/metabolite transporter (DMT)-like permease